MDIMDKRKQWWKEYYAKNKERILEQKKKYYEENKNIITAKSKERYEENKDEIKERMKKYSIGYYQENKDKIANYQKEYYKGNKDKILEQQTVYYNNNKENIAKRSKEYYKNNKEKIQERNKKWEEENKNTPMRVAHSRLSSYNYSDKVLGRGKGDLTAKWIVDNILLSSCLFCGETDWKKLGCHRIDNSKPHTKDNVICCCKKCHRHLPRK